MRCANVGVIAGGLLVFGFVGVLFTDTARGEAQSGADDKVATTAPAGDEAGPPAYHRPMRSRQDRKERQGGHGFTDRRGMRQRDVGVDGSRRGGFGADDRGRGGFGPDGAGQGGFGPDRSGGGGPRHRGMMRPEEIEELMDFAKDYFPELYDELDRAREWDQMAFQRMVCRAGAMLDHMRRADPEIQSTMITEHKARRAIRELEQDYRRATSAEERERIKVEIRTQMTKRFECRQKQARFRIEQLRKRLEAQAKRVEEQEKEKQQVIDREVDRLIKRLEERTTDTFLKP